MNSFVKKIYFSYKTFLPTVVSIQIYCIQLLKTFKLSCTLQPHILQINEILSTEKKHTCNHSHNVYVDIQRQHP